MEKLQERGFSEFDVFQHRLQLFAGFSTQYSSQVSMCQRIRGKDGSRS